MTTEIVGVVASNANTYQLSFAAGRAVPTNSADTIADGLAVRKPSLEALKLMEAELTTIIAVDEEEILQAIRYYFLDTHNVAEGAGAAALAAALKDETKPGQQLGVVLSGSNIDREVFRSALL